MTPAQAKHRLLDPNPSPSDSSDGAEESNRFERGRRAVSRIAASLRLLGTALAAVEACRLALGKDQTTHSHSSEVKEKEGETMRHSANHKRGQSSADSMNTLRSDVATVVKDVTNLVGGRFNDASNKARDIIDGTRERAAAAHERISEFAGQRPLTTIAVSAVAGVVVLKIFSLMRGRH